MGLKDKSAMGAFVVGGLMLFGLMRHPWRVAFPAERPCAGELGGRAGSSVAEAPGETRREVAAQVERISHLTRDLLDYAYQAAAHRAADTRDADGDGIYASPCRVHVQRAAGGPHRRLRPLRRHRLRLRRR